jgi:hypothetical protein
MQNIQETIARIVVPCAVYRNEKLHLLNKTDITSSQTSFRTFLGVIAAPAAGHIASQRISVRHVGSCCHKSSNVSGVVV